MRLRVLLAAPLPGAPWNEAPPGGGECAVVIDVLRATSTLIRALGQGARGVRAAASVEEAWEMKAQHPQALLCGERQGLPIEGFDLGNSPFEYEGERVRDRTLIFASTNGSRAMRAAAGARRRVLAGLVNLEAVAAKLMGEKKVVVVCAGQLGRLALEDAACAGLLCLRLERRGARATGAAARLAKSLAPRDEAEARALVHGACHGRYLRSLGPRFARDVDWCAQLDAVGEAYEV